AAAVGTYTAQFRRVPALRNILPGGNLGGRGLRLLVLTAIAIWGFSGFFRVDPDELGVVFRQVRARRETRSQLSSAIPRRVGAHAKSHAREPHRHRHAAR